MAMVESERLRYSIGVGRYMNGFDPSNSSIPNPSIDWDDQYRRLRNGFTSITVSPNQTQIETVLRDHWPFILTHFCVGFPYGRGWRPITSATLTLAVVITGIDGGTCWMNNPWGNKDRTIAASAVANALTRMQAAGVRPVAYYTQRLT